MTSKGGGGGGYNGNNAKYINDFSKALAGEVRILLAEVGKLRDERRALQYEIAELMSVKSKHGAGGEYSPEWRPNPYLQQLPPDILAEVQANQAPPPPSEDEAPKEARPGWRVVHKRPARREKGKQASLTPASPAPVPALEAPRPDVPAWAQWRPNPLLSPAPRTATPSSPMPSAVPDRKGLFGPPTPPPK